MTIDFAAWTKATGNIGPGPQAVFLDMLNLVAEDKVHLVFGADYRDGKPCLVNGTAQMMSQHSMQPSQAFPEVVRAFDSVCVEMEGLGLNEGTSGYVSPLMAEFLIRNFGEVKPLEVSEPTLIVHKDETGVYVEPSDEAMAEAWVDSMKAPAPAEVENDDYARSFVNVEVPAKSD